MTFDITNALSLPDISDSVAKRDGVLERFGPLFREPVLLTKQDYLDLLSTKHNHHWSGLERLGQPAASNMENLRKAISILVDESLPISQRFDDAAGRVHGVSFATLTPVLLLAYPKKYGVWNGTSEPEMRGRGYWPKFPRGASDGEKYEIINSVLLNLSSELGVDLWTLDALWWVTKLERQNTGHIKGDWFKAVWNMADQAERTASQSNGQAVELHNQDQRAKATRI
jgi:hypothetical protein|tara:strand:+ start:1246 stop:1926 length:681 start_codon:yes stop_codon:yes gene_type:complete